MSALKSQATFGTVAVTTFATAGAVGIATLVYGLTAGPRASRPGLLVFPTMTAQGGGCSLGGSF